MKTCDALRLAQQELLTSGEDIDAYSVFSVYDAPSIHLNVEVGEVARQNSVILGSTIRILRALIIIVY